MKQGKNESANQDNLIKIQRYFKKLLLWFLHLEPVGEYIFARSKRNNFPLRWKTVSMFKAR